MPRLWKCDDGTYDIVDQEGVTYQNVPETVLASAPRLLAALEVLLQRAEALDQSATHDGLQNIEALREARAAIEEAKGV